MIDCEAEFRDIQVTAIKYNLYARFQYKHTLKDSHVDFGNI